jgi:phosphate transport system substrate-binding protein
MSARPARLLCVALAGSCLIGGMAFAKTSHHHAKKAATPSGPVLVWRGDVTTARGVMSDVADAWASGGHGHIDIQSFNTASGLDAIRSGGADLAGTARGSNGSAAEAGLVFTPVAWDGLVLITHPGNPVHGLTLQQVHDIYYGKVANWSQLGGPSLPIDVYAVASPGDGVEYSLRRLLFGRGNQPVAAPRLYVNTAKLEEAVALDPGALGASTLAGVSGNPKVRALSIDGTAPSAATVASGGYKLVTPIYLVTNPSSPHAAQAQAFLDFMATDPAKSALRRHAVLPYQDGAALSAQDSSRRAAILAEVGARAVHETAAPLPTAPAPVAAPGATYAAGAAAAPTSERTLEAKQALDAKRARDQLAAAEASKPSLKGVQGEATTVDAPASHGKDFAKVTSAAYVSAGKAHGSKAGAGKSYTVVKGDTLFSIARAHSVAVDDLRSWNHLKGDSVTPGQTLRLSGHR